MVLREVIFQTILKCFQIRKNMFLRYHKGKMWMHFSLSAHIKSMFPILSHLIFYFLIEISLIISDSIDFILLEPVMFMVFNGHSQILVLVYGKVFPGPE